VQDIRESSIKQILGFWVYNHIDDAPLQWAEDGETSIDPESDDKTNSSAWS
jgi:hypothetical protein